MDVAPLWARRGDVAGSISWQLELVTSGKTCESAGWPAGGVGVVGDVGPACDDGPAVVPGFGAAIGGAESWLSSTTAPTATSSRTAAIPATIAMILPLPLLGGCGGWPYHPVCGPPGGGGYGPVP